MKHLLFTHTLMILAYIVSAQESATIQGIVTSTSGEKVADAYVFLENTAFYSISSKKGSYIIKAPAGTYNLVCSSLDHETKSFQIVLKPGQILEHNFDITDREQVLDEVQITAKSEVQALKETPYNVIAIGTKELPNKTVDLAQALEKSAGLRIRRSGGVGSETSVILNGFRGKQIKIFMDGIPMNNFGSAFQLNNIPVNLADRIEVYKGVVPIELGADALGGAINIVTKKTTNTFLDASYSYGSFNTHKSNVNIGTTTESGLTFQINVFQNYSDNSYKVYTYNLIFEEDDGGSINSYYDSDEHWYKRFHDTYHNETVIGKIGIVGKSWADRMTIGFTMAHAYKEIQNSNIMQIAYGGKLTEANTLMPSFEYFKNDIGIKNLNLRVTANYSKVKNTNVDTLARRYNWAGEYIEKSAKGESSYTYSTFNNNSSAINANLSYRFLDKHTISINNVYNYFIRNSYDEKADEDDDESSQYDRTSANDVLGFSYAYKINERLNASVFQKNYFVKVTGPVEVDYNSNTNETTYEIKERDYFTNGYGAVTSFKLTQDILLKASYEKTVRLPSATELFGDNVLETGADSLKPESSHNFNFNVTYNPSFGTNAKHSLYIDAGFIYRDTKDYIQRDIEQKYGGAYYINHGNVKNIGFDLELRYNLGKSFTAGSTVTYQNITDREKYDEDGKESLHYGDPMKNQPIFFTNGDLSYTLFNVFGKGNTLSFSYFINYMQQYYRGWKSLGGDKITIPEQLSHDFRINYAIQDGRYNLTLEAYNLTNELLYDNYSLQKPGRNFAVSFRYFFNKFKN